MKKYTIDLFADKNCDPKITVDDFVQAKVPTIAHSTIVRVDRYVKRDHDGNVCDYYHEMTSYTYQEYKDNCISYVELNKVMHPGDAGFVSLNDDCDMSVWVQPRFKYNGVVRGNDRFYTARIDKYAFKLFSEDEDCRELFMPGLMTRSRKYTICVSMWFEGMGCDMNMLLY